MNLLLHDPTADRIVRIRISASAGRAIAAELVDLPSAEGEVADILGSVIQALGAQITAVRLATDGKHAWAIIDIESAGAVSELTVDASPAMVTACRLGIPVYIDEPEPAADDRPTDIPAVFRDAFETLDRNPETG